MKLNKILMCAVAAGAMAFVSDNAQAVVISGNLYTPLNLTLTVNVVGSNGKIQQKTGTSKKILNDLISEQGFTYPKGTFLAVGPGGDIYAITKTAVLDDLSGLGYFSFSPVSSISTSTGTFGTTAYKYSEAGLVTIEYADDADLTDLTDNDGAFDLTGSYIYNEKDSVPVNGVYNESANFKSSSLSGDGYWFSLDTEDLLPMSGSASGSASGKVTEE
ncbi:MAG: hypothetical protein ACLP2Y_12475 [Limisphaerales bacterium]